MEKFKDIRVLTITGLLVAICTVLGFFKIPVTNLIEIRFAFLPIAVCGALFGPVIGGTCGFLSDILGYLVRPTGAFFPGFTIASILSGVVFGLFFHKKQLTIPRIILAELVDTIISSLVIYTISLSILYGTPLPAVLAARLPKILIMFPINCILMILILRPVFRRISIKTGERGEA